MHMIKNRYNGLINKWRKAHGKLSIEKLMQKIIASVDGKINRRRNA